MDLLVRHYACMLGQIFWARARLPEALAQNMSQSKCVAYTCQNFSSLSYLKELIEDFCQYQTYREH